MQSVTMFIAGPTRSALPVIMTSPGTTPSYYCTGLVQMRMSDGGRAGWLGGREIAADDRATGIVVPLRMRRRH